ncbi:MAG: HAMP domain-containing histidine kinase [Bacteroidaceae bacterium]|nr:HAMP domain-containing histidine kinase [Bacteroidaceae bacterium]
MAWINKTKKIKYILIAAAIVIAAISLVYSHFLVKDLEDEAGNKMSIWAEAMQSLNNADENTDLNLVLKVLNTNNTIPVIVLNDNGEVEMTRNIDCHELSASDSISRIQDELEHMRSAGHSIKINYAPTPLSDDSLAQTEQVDDMEQPYMEILYDNSLVLKRLAIYPYIQIAILALFAIIIIFVIVSSQRAEQNRVWVGLTKETAHQLGTPISSLMAWMEILRENYPEDPMLPEFEKDVDRLNLIAERFSKIGSLPEPQLESINEVIWHVVNYLKPRSSANVAINCHLPENDCHVMMNASLFEWVIENLCKNAIDAMGGKGKIDITVKQEPKRLAIEISDTGKGIAKSRFKSVFEPGYTTKRRGWGLGLSLAKRIVEKYHKGRIFVKSSEIGKGTTFRIELRK